LFYINLGPLISIILITKNAIITGYPFYPFDVLPLQVDWKVPQVLLEFIVDMAKNTAYIKNSSLQGSSILVKINSWLHLGGINRFFNIGILPLFIFGLFIAKIKKQIKYKVLCLILTLHFIILLLTAPQFRFFLPEFVFLSVLVVSYSFTYLKINIKFIRFILLAVILIPLLAINFIDYEIFTANKLLQEKDRFKWSQIVIPEKNSKYADLVFKKVREGNLEYYSPPEHTFFWNNGNGTLPCVNLQQLKYFKIKFHYIPQLRTQYLKDGFYSKKIP